jgi:hypothetical protein
MDKAERDTAKGGFESEIHAIIESYLPSNDKKKSKHGAVFTPVSMIDTLYDRFPSSVWSDPHRTWLDPATGIGNFALVLFLRLMKGLQRAIPSSVKRAKHIIERMLFLVEIDKSSAKICKEILHKLCPTATPNLYEGDFLTLFDKHPLDWPKTFDAVVGNPPYNLGGTGLEGSKRTHIVFAERGLEMLAPRGYLAYICPPSYRETGTPMNELFHTKYHGHFVFIKIYGAAETFRLFSIQGRVDGFIFQKGVSGTSMIDDEYGVVVKGVRLDLDRHLPNFGYTIFEKLWAKTQMLGAVEAFRNTEMSSVKAATFGCGGKHKILHLILEKGRRVFRTTKEHPLAHEPKIMVNGLGVPYVFHDKRGEYGPSQTPVVILRPSAPLVNFLQSDFFSFVAWGLRLTGNNNLPYLFDYVPQLGKEKNPYRTMEDIRRGLGLTAAEVAFVTSNFHRYTYADVDLIEPCVRSTRKKT